MLDKELYKSMAKELVEALLGGPKRVWGQSKDPYNHNANHTKKELGEKIKKHKALAAKFLKQYHRHSTAIDAAVKIRDKDKPKKPDDWSNYHETGRDREHPIDRL